MSDVGAVVKLINRFIDSAEKISKRRKIRSNKKTVDDWRDRFQKASAENDTETLNRLLAEIKTGNGFKRRA